MAGRRPETIVKRAREQALREKRERKQAKKEARAAAKIDEADEIATEDVAEEPEAE